MFGFLSGMGARIVTILVVLVLLIAAFFYVKSLQSSLEAAKAEQARLVDVVSSQKLAMDQLKMDITRMNNIQTEYGKKVSDFDNKVKDISDKFNKDKNGKPRDFGKDIATHPDAMELSINRATIDAHRCNELITGSPLTKDELSGKVKNSICPELLGGKR